MANEDKAVAAVVRGTGSRRELLVFRHPIAGVQVPKGTVEPGEDLAAAALRELHEESGLTLDCVPVPVGQWDRTLDGTYGEEASFDLHRWHVHLFEAPAGLREAWRHTAVGSAEEEGLVFEYYWLALDAALKYKLHPVFADTIDILLAHYRAD
jgi:8-oxo-dGTP pyrophosphatase MutT (NUDIX family)